MESTVWSAEGREALAAVEASVAALAAALVPVAGSGVDGAGVAGADHADRSGADPLRGAESGPLGVDPLWDRADACLDGLAELARLEARFAAVKVWLTASYVEASRALAPPALSLNDRTVLEMAMVAELACVLTVSEHAAGALLGEAQALTTSLPLTLGALQAGTISWAHARILVDETTGLGPAGAAGPAAWGGVVCVGVCRSRGRRSWSPSRSSRSLVPGRNRRSWTGTGRFRRRWPRPWSPTARAPSTGS